MDQDIPSLDADIAKARELAQSPITDQTHAEALAVVDRLMSAHWRNSDVALSLLIDQLAKVIQAYEEEAYPFPEPTPVEMLEHLLEMRGLTPDEFAQAIGLSDISSILNHKRAITVDQAISFGKFFAVDPSLFDAELAPL